MVVIFFFPNLFLYVAVSYSVPVLPVFLEPIASTDLIAILRTASTFAKTVASAGDVALRYFMIFATLASLKWHVGHPSLCHLSPVRLWPKIFQLPPTRSNCHATCLSNWLFFFFLNKLTSRIFFFSWPLGTGLDIRWSAVAARLITTEVYANFDARRFPAKARFDHILYHWP